MKIRVLVLLLLCIGSLSASAQSVEADSDETYVIEHFWTYKGADWSWTFEVEKRMYDYYRYERLHISDDYNRYVFSEYDRQCIKNIVTAFREAGDKAGYSDYDNVCNAVCFVQSLDYALDLDSRGEEEYVRYPVETLVDGQGDCEDTSVLLAAILDEMGYDVAFLLFPDHLAMGVNCSDDFEGLFYLYNGKRYYYVETTGKNWKIGAVPKEFENKDVKVIPLVNEPVMHLKSCEYQGDSYYLTDAKVGFTLICNYENMGPGRAEDLYLHVVAELIGKPNETIVERFYELGNLGEGESNQVKVRMQLPRPCRAMLEYRIEGSNVETQTMTLEGIRLK